jgi:class 3 adenylate cyclase
VSGVTTNGGFCAILYQRSPDADAAAFEKADNFHAQSTAGLIYQVLLHRVRMFNPFAPAVSEAYWDDALLPAKANRRTPPWTKTKGSISTATLSLDLRKSTFCMENADPAWKFALWLDLLVQILTRVTHLHGGVFDKFTGDGALVHFLAPDESEAAVADAMVTAFDCALSMHRAMRRHVELLSTFLHFDSDILGAAIGIDVAPAFWSLDHRNNPITVGHAVVNACRIGDKTEAGASRFTNGAYQYLRGLRDVGGMKRVSFVSKEVPEDMKVKVWELPRGVVPAERLVDQTDQIVDEVHKQWKEERM